MKAVRITTLSLLCGSVAVLGFANRTEAGVLMACFELLEQSGSDGDESGGVSDWLGIQSDADSPGVGSLAGPGSLGAGSVGDPWGGDLLAGFTSGAPGGSGYPGGGNGFPGSGDGEWGGLPDFVLPHLPGGGVGGPFPSPEPTWNPMPSPVTTDVSDEQPSAGDAVVFANPEPATLLMYAAGLLSVAAVSAARRARLRRRCGNSLDEHPGNDNSGRSC